MITLEFSTYVTHNSPVESLAIVRVSALPHVTHEERFLYNRIRSRETTMGALGLEP